MGKHKKKSKTHKHKSHKQKKRKHSRRNSSSNSSSSEEEWVERKVDNKYEKKDKHSSSENEFVEKDACDKPINNKREEWMDMDQMFATFSSDKEKLKRKENEKQKLKDDLYNPATSSREINPYWKSGGTGLPSLKKPSDSIDFYETNNESKAVKNLNWKKTIDKEKPNTKQNSSPIKTKTENLNILAAKLIKAEIMGNEKLIQELKLRLEEARQNESNSEVLLTETDSKGFSRPYIPKDATKKRKHETHENTKRTKYFPDDDKYSLQQMFQQEKFNDSDKINKEFAEIASKVKKNDSLSDLFVDTIRKEKRDKNEVDKVINQNRKILDALDGCTKCINNLEVRNLVIETNELMYISLPKYEPLTDGHCFITPIRHVSCSIQLDENEWDCFMDIRRKLVNVFSPKNIPVFFETAVNFHKHPHMHIECVSIPEKMGSLAPIYFKKAIDESEYEWSHNKKLISLKGKDVRRAIPKGLAYFFVSFGMDEGFAHVIEDQRSFPKNFAQEIIGGMLDLSHRKWKRPDIEKFEQQSKRVVEFNKLWQT